MSVGWIERCLCVFFLCGCERILVEPPPPPSRQEIPVAPPGARGARAAGTEAAPKPYVEPEPGQTPETDEDGQELAPNSGERRPKDVPL